MAAAHLVEATQLYHQHHHLVDATQPYHAPPADEEPTIVDTDDDETVAVEYDSDETTIENRGRPPADSSQEHSEGLLSSQPDDDDANGGWTDCMSGSGEDEDDDDDEVSISLL